MGFAGIRQGLAVEYDLGLEPRPFGWFPSGLGLHGKYSSGSNHDVVNVPALKLDVMKDPVALGHQLVQFPADHLLAQRSYPVVRIGSQFQSHSSPYDPSACD